jgi:hypothetical protein
MRACRLHKHSPIAVLATQANAIRAMRAKAVFMVMGCVGG